MTSTTPRTSTTLLARVVFAGLLSLVVWLDREHLAEDPDSTPAFSEAAVSQELAFRDVAEELGLVFQHQVAQLDPKLVNVQPHVSAVGASVSVSDVNGDGRPDLYLTSSRQGSPNALFVQRADGSFEERAEQAGLAQLNEPGTGSSMHSVWADIDNDGDEDLFVAKWGRPRLFLNERREVGELSFRDVTDAAGLPAWSNANCAIWFDADHDGLVDLFLANYFHQSHDMWNLETTKVMQDSFEFSENGGDNLLFRNLGDGRFEDVTADSGLASTRWTMAAAAADFDQDGDTDLYCANDYGPEELFLNDGAGHFSQELGARLADDSKSGMCVTLGDVRNRGRFDVYVTNISEPGYLFQGNNLRLNGLAEGSGFLNVADGRVADCGWAWGAQFGDLDNDGRVDLFVSNGFVSADPDADYWYGMGKVAVGSGGIFADAANWPPMGTRSLSGFQRSRVLLNRGGGRFADVALQVGVDDVYDGRAVALADLSGRGQLDVIVANQGGPLVVYRSEDLVQANWIAFELEGRSSNRSAIGAELRVVAGDEVHLRIVDGGSGFSAQNARALHVGLGDATSVDKIEIRWPSGVVDELDALELGRLHRITESAP